MWQLWAHIIMMLGWEYQFCSYGSLYDDGVGHLSMWLQATFWYKKDAWISSIWYFKDDSDLVIVDY